MKEQEFRKIKSFMSFNIQQLSRILSKNDLKSNLTTEEKVEIEEDLKTLKDNRDKLIKIHKEVKLDHLHFQAVAIKNDMETLKRRIHTPSVYSLYDLRGISNFMKTKKKKK
jgi:hypothetical protein